MDLMVFAAFIVLVLALLAAWRLLTACHIDLSVTVTEFRDEQAVSMATARLEHLPCWHEDEGEGGVS